MVSNKQQLAYVLAAIAVLEAKSEDRALQPAMGVKVDTNGNGVAELGGRTTDV